MLRGIVEPLPAGAAPRKPRLLAAKTSALIYNLDSFN
jgi:hypothetical protein